MSYEQFLSAIRSGNVDDRTLVARLDAASGLLQKLSGQLEAAANSHNSEGIDAAFSQLQDFTKFIATCTLEFYQSRQQRQYSPATLHKMHETLFQTFTKVLSYNGNPVAPDNMRLVKASFKQVLESMINQDHGSAAELIYVATELLNTISAFSADGPVASSASKALHGIINANMETFSRPENQHIVSQATEQFGQQVESILSSVNETNFAQLHPPLKFYILFVNFIFKAFSKAEGIYPTFARVLIRIKSRLSVLGLTVPPNGTFPEFYKQLLGMSNFLFTFALSPEASEEQKILFIRNFLFNAPATMDADIEQDTAARLDALACILATSHTFARTESLQRHLVEVCLRNLFEMIPYCSTALLALSPMPENEGLLHLPGCPYMRIRFYLGKFLRGLDGGTGSISMSALVEQVLVENIATFHFVRTRLALDLWGTMFKESTELYKKHVVDLLLALACSVVNNVYKKESPVMQATKDVCEYLLFYVNSALERMIPFFEPSIKAEFVAKVNVAELIQDGSVSLPKISVVSSLRPELFEKCYSLSFQDLLNLLQTCLRVCQEYAVHSKHPFVVPALACLRGLWHREIWKKEKAIDAPLLKQDRINHTVGVSLEALKKGYATSEQRVVLLSIGVLNELVPYIPGKHLYEVLNFLSSNIEAAPWCKLACADFIGTCAFIQEETFSDVQQKGAVFAELRKLFLFLLKDTDWIVFQRAVEKFEVFARHTLFDPSTLKQLIPQETQAIVLGFLGRRAILGDQVSNHSDNGASLVALSAALRANADELDAEIIKKAKARGTDQQQDAQQQHAIVKESITYAKTAMINVLNFLKQQQQFTQQQQQQQGLSKDDVAFILREMQEIQWIKEQTDALLKHKQL